MFVDVCPGNQQAPGEGKVAQCIQNRCSCKIQVLVCRLSCSCHDAQPGGAVELQVLERTNLTSVYNLALVWETFLQVLMPLRAHWCVSFASGNNPCFRKYCPFGWSRECVPGHSVGPLFFRNRGAYFRLTKRLCQVGCKCWGHVKTEMFQPCIQWH